MILIYPERYGHIEINNGEEPLSRLGDRGKKESLETTADRVGNAVAQIEFSTL